MANNNNSLGNTTTQVISDTGDQRHWTIEIVNLSDHPCFAAVMSFTFPPGVSLIGPKIAGTSQLAVSTGTFNPINDTWVIGDMQPNQIIQTTFLVQVDDIALVDPLDQWFEIHAVLTSSCIETDTCDNQITLVLIKDTCPTLNLSAGVNKGTCKNPNLKIG